MSVYWAALLEAGRDAEAANVVAAHRAGVAAAMAYVEQQAAYVRSGYHGKTASGQSVGVYEQANGLAWIRWDHSTSRAQQPQLHSHVTVLNRAETTSDGVIRALASRGFKPIKQAAEAIYTKVSQETLAALQRAWCSRPARTARRARSSGSARSCWPRRRRAPRTSPRGRTSWSSSSGRPTGGIRSPVETRRIHRAAWRETRQPKNHAVAPRRQMPNWAEPVRDELGEALTAADAAGARVAPRRAPRAAGLRDARPGAGAAGGAAHGAGSATPRGTSGTWPRRSPTSRSAPRRSPSSRRTWPPRCCARATGTGS